MSKFSLWGFFSDFFKRISFIGVYNKGRLADEDRRIILSNQISLLLLGFASPYLFIFRFLGLPTLSDAVIPIDIIFFLGFILNRFRFYILARFFIIINVAFGLVFYATSLGKEAGLQLVFFALISIPFVVFEPEAWEYITLAIIIPLACVIYLEASHYSLFPKIVANQTCTSTIYYSMVAVTCGLIILSIRFYFISNLRAERFLLKTNSQLQTAYENIHTAQEIITKLTQQATMGALMNTISHEVKNPLSGIYACCSGIMRMHPSEEIQFEVKAIMEEVMRLKELIVGLLKDPGNMDVGHTTVDINATLGAVLLLARKEANSKGIVFEQRLGEVLPSVKGSMAYLSHAVLNVLVNAIAHTPVAGRILVETLFDGMHVVISVSDTGPGIPKEILPHIFESRVTTGRVEGNVGLGLHFVKQVVDAHGGKVDVEDVPEGGVCFRILVPAVLTNTP